MADGFDAWVAAGATVVSTPTLMVHEARAMHALVAELVARRDARSPETRVAAVVGPPALSAGTARAVAMAALSAGADEIALPTITRSSEAVAAVELAGEIRAPVLLSLSPLASLGSASWEWMCALPVPASVRVGLNCLEGTTGLDRVVPRFVERFGAVVLQPSTGLGGEDGAAADWAGAVTSCARDYGLHMIGGCCGVSPEHLAAVPRNPELSGSGLKIDALGKEPDTIP